MRRLIRTALIGAVLLIALLLVALPCAGALLAPGSRVGHHQRLPGGHMLQVELRGCLGMLPGHLFVGVDMQAFSAYPPPGLFIPLTPACP